MKTSSAKILLALVLTSCTYHDLNPRYTLEAYHIAYMLYPSGAILPSGDGGPTIVTVQYDHLRRPVKRTGGIIAAPFFLGYDYSFTNKVYEDVSYDGNNASVVRKENFPDTDWPPVEKKVFFENGKISRIIESRYELVPALDTIDFFYDAADVLKKTVGKEYFYSSLADNYRLMTHTIREYFFAGGNLIKIEGIEHFAPMNNATTLELFEDYDHAPNPTRQLSIFDETFYRSLSRNNFRKYSFKRRNMGGQVTDTRDLSWTFEYDADGLPLFK